MEYTNIISIVAGLSGFIGAVWINRIRIQDKFKYDNKLEVLKSAISEQKSDQESFLARLSLVHKSKFEKEFSSIQNIWVKFDLAYVATRWLMGVEITMANSPFDNLESEEKLQRHMINCNDFSDILRQNDPFIDKKIASTFGNMIIHFNDIHSLAERAIVTMDGGEFNKLLSESSAVYEKMNHSREILNEEIRSHLAVMHIID